MLLRLQTHFVFNDTATTEIYTLSLHDALPISSMMERTPWWPPWPPRALMRMRPGSRSRSSWMTITSLRRSEEHTSELQSPDHLVCRLLLEKKHTNQSQSKVHLTSHTTYVLQNA